jgi:hypothetical protein
MWLQGNYVAFFWLLDFTARFFFSQPRAFKIWTLYSYLKRLCILWLNQSINQAPVFFPTSQGTSRVPACNVEGLLSRHAVEPSSRQSRDSESFLLPRVSVSSRNRVVDWWFFLVSWGISRAYDPQKVLALIVKKRTRDPKTSGGMTPQFPGMTCD